MNTTHGGSDQEAEDPQKKTHGKGKQCQQKGHQKHAHRNQQPANQWGRCFGRRHSFLIVAV